MKVSAIVTLLLGLVIGFALGRSTGTGGSTPVAQRPSTPNRPTRRERPTPRCTRFRWTILRCAAHPRRW